MGLFRRVFGSGLRFPLDMESLRRGPVNDAQAYGVVVREPRAEPGETVYQVIRVHHLTPEENRGNRHIYVEVLDEEGKRIPGARVRISWQGDSRVFTVKDASDRPGVAFAMDKWSVYDVEVEDAPSTRVVGITAGHPDEGPGNREFRHSFLVVFQRTRVPVPEVVSPPPSAEVERPSLEEGATPVEVEPEPFPAPEPVTVTPPPSPEEEIAPSVLEEISPPPTETEVAESEAEPQPEVEAVPEDVEKYPGAEIPSEQDVTVVVEGAAPVPVEAEAPPQPVAEVDEGVEEVVPEEGAEREAVVTTPEAPALKALDTYVLFVDAESPSTLAAFFVAMDEIISAGVPFGFDALDAAEQARRVVVVGKASDEVLTRLQARCEEVVTVEGDSTRLQETLEDVLSVG